MTSRKPSEDDPLPDHLARWLEAVNRRLRAALVAEGMRDFPELRGSHRRILQMIPANGVRITDLAATASMTKQSLGEFVDWLEKGDFVASRRQESDGRVRLIFRTPHGDEAADAAQTAIEAIEQRWRQEIGADRFDIMKQALRDLGRDILPTAAPPPSGP